MNLWTSFFFCLYIRWDEMTYLTRLLWRLHNKMYRKQLALSKPSVNGTCYYHQTENIKGVNIPPKSPFGGTEIHRTQRTKVCQVLQVPVLMNKWKCSVMSIAIVLCKWHSHGACKQFLVSRKHCPWELVYSTNLLLQLSPRGLHRGALAPCLRKSWQILNWCLQSPWWFMGSQEHLEA